MASNNTLNPSVRFDEKAANKFAATDICPSDERFGQDRASIRARVIGFAGGKAAEFWVAHGVLRTSSPLPRGIKQGIAKQCFKNAALLALGNPDEFTYCEGWAQVPGLQEATTHHAWCLDRKGNVVDPTWEHEEGNEYLGIPIKVMALNQNMLASGEWGVFRHGSHLPSGFSSNPKAFIESNFTHLGLEGEAI